MPFREKYRFFAISTSGIVLGKNFNDEFERLHILRVSEKN